MQSIRVLAYVCFVFAALGVVLAFVEEFFFVIQAMVMFVTGVLLIALDKIITTLVEIRDALLKTSMSIDVGITSDSVRADATEVEAKVVRTMQEIQADVERLKNRLP